MQFLLTEYWLQRCFCILQLISLPPCPIPTVYRRALQVEYVVRPHHAPVRQEVARLQGRGVARVALSAFHDHRKRFGFRNKRKNCKCLVQG